MAVNAVLVIVHHLAKPKAPQERHRLHAMRQMARHKVELEVASQFPSRELAHRISPYVYNLRKMYISSTTAKSNETLYNAPKSCNLTDGIRNSQGCGPLPDLKSDTG